MPIILTHNTGVYIVCAATEVVEAAANEEFVGTTKDGDRPMTGSRKVDTWSMCFQGGTFDRVKERPVSLPAIAVCVSCNAAYSIVVKCHSHLPYILIRCALSHHVVHRRVCRMHR